jgi:hypothetical protein
MLINVKEHGAYGNGITDDYAAIQSIITSCTADDTIYAPSGKYKLSEPLVTDKPIHLKGDGHSSLLLADGEFASLEIDSTINHVKGGSINDLRFASPTNAEGSAGVFVKGSANTFVPVWDFSNLRFSGLHAGFKVDKPHGVSGLYNVSLFSVNTINNIIVDEYGLNRSQYGILANGANTLTVQSGIIRAEVSGIEIGDGNTGMGDILISGIHFNFGQQSIYLNGSTASADYKNKFSINNCQFDGNNAKCIKARNLIDLRLSANNYADGIFNDIQNCEYSQIDFNTFESRYGIAKKGIPAAQTANVFKVKRTESTGYSTCYIEVSISALLAGRGMVSKTEAYSIMWNAGTPTISPAHYSHNFSVSGTSLTLNKSIVSNECVFSVSHNSSLPNTEINCSVRILGEAVIVVPL